MIPVINTGRNYLRSPIMQFCSLVPESRYILFLKSLPKKEFERKLKQMEKTYFYESNLNP